MEFFLSIVRRTRLEMPARYVKRRLLGEASAGTLIVWNHKRRGGKREARKEGSPEREAVDAAPHAKPSAASISGNSTATSIGRGNAGASGETASRRSSVRMVGSQQLGSGESSDSQQASMEHMDGSGLPWTASISKLGQSGRK